MTGKLLPTLLLLALLAACDLPPENALKLATLENADAGLSLRELPPQSLKAIGLPFGMAVVRAGGLAERAGLKIGDVVYGINEKKARSLEEFSQALRQRDGRVGLLVRRGRTDLYVAVDFAGAAPARPPKPAPGSRETLLRT